MALSDGMTPADIAAVTGNNDGFGFGNGGGAWWILILFLFALMNGGNWGGNGINNAMLPYAMTETTQSAMQRGFDNQATQTVLGNINTTLANGFSDAAIARCNAQTNTLQSMNQIAMGLQQNGADNRLGIADLKYTIATENCADRQAISDGIRDLMAQNTQNTNAIIQSQNQGFQGIQDKLCQMEIDSLKSQNEQLRTQLNMANLAASQNAQTAQLIQDNNAQTAALIQRIAPAPIPAYPVANPNGCGGFGGFGGCGAA
ncbi:MAG: hypothetical protein J6M62_03585 [Selenomonadaceae bacterium]|nr:hypothetical protein [Selenomonadaceae bacterium]MBO6304148.1 hypothetical protein [Selenomonadaceae bacterium]